VHRTLYTPTMIETFKTCTHAYDLAFLQQMPEPEKLGVVCKQFILRTLAEINKGKISTVPHVQKYMGQNWPLEKIGGNKESSTKAFLFAYKALTRYVNKPYAAVDAKIVGVALKVRARIPHLRVYLEDTLDLVLWHPEQKTLEFVDFQIQPIKASDPAWPSTSTLVKKFLAERLQTRWPFEQLSLISQRVGLQDFAPVPIKIDETIYRLHWFDIVNTLEQIKAFENRDLPEDYADHSKRCRHCQILEDRYTNAIEESPPSVSMTA
jgi:hypothetical protein